MMMRGDLNKVITQVNAVLEGATKRIDVLEARLDALETPEEAPLDVKRGPGRPPGSKNKKKEV